MIQLGSSRLAEPLSTKSDQSRYRPLVLLGDAELTRAMTLIGLSLVGGAHQKNNFLKINIFLKFYLRDV
jgi:hypothetical protein